MYCRMKIMFPLACISLLVGTGLTGCDSRNGVSLKPSHGAITNKDLGIAPDKQSLTRVEWEAGGSSNQCLPTAKLAVLIDGTVYCWRKTQVNEECPKPFTHQGNIPVQEAQTLMRDTRDEIRASRPEDNGGCMGAWSSIRLLDQGERRYYDIDLSCQPETLMQQNDRRLHDIWKRVCSGNVGPEGA